MDQGPALRTLVNQRKVVPANSKGQVGPYGSGINVCFFKHKIDSEKRALKHQKNANKAKPAVELSESMQVRIRRFAKKIANFKNSEPEKDSNIRILGMDLHLLLPRTNLNIRDEKWDSYNHTYSFEVHSDSKDFWMKFMLGRDHPNLRLWIKEKGKKGQTRFFTAVRQEGVESLLSAAFRDIVSRQPSLSGRFKGSTMSYVHDKPMEFEDHDSIQWVQ